MASDAGQFKGPSIAAKNMRQPTPFITSAGQPSEADIHQLKQLGYSAIIDLRGLSENRGYNERKVVKSVNLDYLTIPISSAADLTLANTKKLDSILSKHSGDVFIHCASGNRVGAMLALHAFYIEGASVEEAIDFGKSAGLTKFEAKVRPRLKR